MVTKVLNVTAEIMSIVCLVQMLAGC